MYKKLVSGLSILAITFAFVLGFGPFDEAKARSGSYNLDYGHQGVLIGIDEAQNLVSGHSDRDMDHLSWRNMAKGDNYNWNYGEADLFAVDEAHNNLNGRSDRDIRSDMDMPNRGLGNYSEER